LQRRVADVLAELPADDRGTVGVIDETSSQKWGDQTPGVQRQYLGCVGKIDNGIVTVHVAVAQGTFQALLDADLYLPASWAMVRERCRAEEDSGRGGVPSEVADRPGTVAPPAGERGDLRLADLRRGVREQDAVLVDTGPDGPEVRGRGAGELFGASVGPGSVLPGGGITAGARHGRLEAVSDHAEDAGVGGVAGAGGAGVGGPGLALAGDGVHESTGEVKYFVTNAVDEPLTRILRVAFRRAKQEAGLMHYEGRQYVGLMRHLIMALVVLGFVAEQTERLRG
jgi:hypothetical protein